MLTLFSKVSHVFNVSTNLEKINIDNGVAKLNYRVTTTALIVATIFVTAQQYIGDPINCVQDSASGVPQHFLDTYCFFFGTFTLKDKNGPEDKPFLRLGPIEAKSEFNHISYYPWVPYYLMFLAMTFYSSHFMWKTWEGGKLKSILAGMHLLAYSITDDQIGDIPGMEFREEKVNQIAHYMWQRIKYKMNTKWALILIASEIYTLLHVAAAYWLTDLFIGGNFVFILLNRKTILNVFPTLSKCTFHKYGSSGSIEKRDSLCLLGLNNVNAKVFYFFHFWFPILLIVSSLAVIWRFVSLILYRSLIFNRIVLKQTRSSKLNDDDRKIILNKISFCDWIFLCYVSGNSDNFVFQEIYSVLARIIRNVNYGKLQKDSMTKIYK